MSILVTERWSPPKAQFGASGIRANRVFDVTGVTTETAAVAAVVSFDGTTAYNSQHPLSTWMYVDNQEVETPGFNVFKVTITYSSTPAGRHIDPSNPLSEPYEYNFQWGYRSDGCDSDTFGNPIINTAGQPFDTDPPCELLNGTLIVLRNEPFYNVAQAIQYSNAVNNAPVTFGGVYTLLQGQACIREISPVTPITRDSLFTTVKYSIELRAGLKRDPDGYEDAFKVRILNRGSRGWYNDTSSGFTKTGYIANVISGGTQIASNVLLNDLGKPIDPGYVIMVPNGNTAAPANSPTLMPAGSVVEKTFDANGALISTWVKYFPKGIQLRDLSVLGL